jgi:pyruvate/2-oxoglutarate/acetoin dehydrogenase E1 component
MSTPNKAGPNSSGPSSAPQAAEGRVLSYVDAIREALDQEMAADPSVFVMGLDVDDHKAIQGSTRGLLETHGPERIFTTPLSEDAMTGVAVGAAMAGMRPVHVHIRMDFLMLCMNQLINIAAKSHYMYGGATKVPMVVRSMIGKSWGQGAQHSQNLNAMFAHVPGLKVVSPSNAYDAKGMLISAIRDNNPVIFTEHRLLYFTEAYVPEEPFALPFGEARICGEGADITLLGVSNMVMECLRARELLAEVGIKAEVVDPATLVPLDMETIAKSAAKTGNLLVVDNAWTNCGFSAEILARLAESGAADGVKMRRMGFAATTCPTTPWLEEHFYPNPATIAEAARELLEPGNGWKPDPERAKLSYQMQFRGPF